MSKSLRGVGIEVFNRQSFHNEAAWQGACAVCGTRKGPWQAHHVIYEQHLRRDGFPRYNTRNALRLCKAHHDQHHARQHVVLVSQLTLESLVYGFEIFGSAAVDYFTRYYRRGPEDRLDELLAAEAL